MPMGPRLDGGEPARLGQGDRPVPLRVVPHGRGESATQRLQFVLAHRPGLRPVGGVEAPGGAEEFIVAGVGRGRRAAAFPASAWLLQPIFLGL